MYTQCPECWSAYRIAAETLAAGHGRVRCGHCGSVFDATPSLTERLPETVDGAWPRRPEPDVPPVLLIPVATEASTQNDLFPELHPEPLAAAKRDHPRELVPKAEPEPLLPGVWLSRAQLATDAVRAAPLPVTGPAPRQGSETLGTMPSFVAPTRRAREATSPPLARSWTWSTIALTLLLAGQLAWVFRDPLLQQPWLRSAWQRACAPLGCEVPLPFYAERWSMLSRDVRPHPQARGALLISATLRNEARIAQAFPVLEVRLTGLNRSMVAARRFSPLEYLSDPDAAKRGVEPGATVPITLEAVDPETPALSFEFDVRPPQS